VATWLGLINRQYRNAIQIRHAQIRQKIFTRRRQQLRIYIDKGIRETTGMPKKIAVLLSGCGVMDGSEIHEAVFTLLALDNAGAEYTCCAPDIAQSEVVNHATGKASGESRNVLVESARIARGNILKLSDVRAADFDAIIMPGGYGAAKNLCSYARDGVKQTVQPEVARVIREFAQAKKPIGSICISPVVVAGVFEGSLDIKPSLTIGTDTGVAGDITRMGSEHVACGVREFHVDRANKIVSTPAYMLGKGPAEVFVGIEKLVKAILELA
jgi:enhancing lycopene biosynthesis protein 2